MRSSRVPLIRAPTNDLPDHAGIPVSMVSAAAQLAADPVTTVVDGPFVLAALLAVAAGFVSFASPCVVPLVPGYLSYLVGLVGKEGTDTGQTVGGRLGTATRTRAVVATLWFILGFTVVFLLQSMLVLGVAGSLTANTEVLTRVGGVIVIVLGLAMLGLIKPLQVERRIHARPRGAVAGPLLLGGVFSLGWTVCIGPTLGAVLSLAWSSDWNGNAWRGLFLVLFYCAGLGIPFLLLAFGFSWAASAAGFLRRHSRTIQIVGAVSMIVVGLLMVTGIWSNFLAWLQVNLAQWQEGMSL